MASISSSIISDWVYIYNGELAYRNTIIDGGYLFVESGGTANATTVNSGGSMMVNANGVATSTTINSGGRMMVAYATATSTTVNPGGVLDVNNGANALQIIENGGLVLTTYGSEEISFVPNSFSGLVLDDRQSATVHSGTTATATTVNSGGKLCIFSGGTATGIVVSKGGLLEFTVAPDTYIEGTSAGSAFLMKNAFISGYTIHESESLSIISGTVIDTIVKGSWYDGMFFASELTIGESSFADNTVIERGEVIISSGGTANNTTLKDGGAVAVQGGTMNNITVYGGDVDVYGGVVNSVNLISGSLWLGEGTANSVFVDKDGRLDLYGGTATIVFNPWGPGKITNYIGGSGKVIYLDRDASVYYETRREGLKGIIKSDVLSGINIASSQRAVVFDGGIIKNADVVTNGLLEVSSGGVVQDLSVYRGGNLTVSSGGTANRMFAAGANAEIKAETGAKTTRNVIQDLAVLDLYGTASSNTVKDMGQLWVYSGGIATSSVVSDWGAVYLLSGGSVNDISVESCGKVHIGHGGTATAVRENGGSVEVEDGANVTFLANTFRGAMLTSGEATLHSGTTALGATVKNAKMTVFDGGIAQETVLDGGTLTISSGGMVTGPLSISNAAVVSACDGSIVDFDITSATGTAPLINDLSQISGTPDYTITVSAEQKAGSYILAEGSEDFDGSITIGTEDVNYGSLTVNGETVKYGSTSYALKKDLNKLSLEVYQEKPCDLTITDLTFKNASGGSTLYTDQDIIYTFTVLLS